MPHDHAIIYIPGLGDSRARGQRLAVAGWRWQGVEAHLFQMHWADGEDLAPKLARLRQLAERLRGEGKAVSLIGASAGGSVLIHIYASQPELFHGAVSICGKISNPHTVAQSYYDRNRAFYQSMARLEDSLARLGSRQRSRMLSLHPLYDPVVPVADTELAGVRGTTMPVAGHFLGIAYGLTLGSFRAIRFLKQLPPSPAPPL